MLGRDRKLDLVGLALVGVVLFSVGLLVFGAQDLPGEETAPPSANWSIERTEADRAVITHEGGEAIPAEEVAITVNGRNRPTPFEGTIQEGDTGQLAVADGRTVELYWIDGGGTRELLHEQEL